MAPSLINARGINDRLSLGYDVRSQTRVTSQKSCPEHMTNFGEIYP
ncbi:hypothetical protein BN903_26 [Halorubrum sp. AJ67]|nr:hypothetical protein BN903_26 [Halorubrum sp. AJ67]